MVFEADQRHDRDKHDGHQCSDIGQEVEQRRGHAPDQRVGHAERPQAETYDGAEADIDNGDGER